MEIARIYKRPGDEYYTPHYAVVPVLKYDTIAGYSLVA